MKTKGELEAEVSQLLIRFEKEYMGRGPLETRSFLIEDMIVVRLRDVLTPAEHKLAESSDPVRGRDLIKQMRQQLIETGSPLLTQQLTQLIGIPVRSMHTDISTRTGERIIVFTLEAKAEVRV